MSGTTETSAAASLGLGAAQLTFDDEFDTFTSSVNGYTGWATTLPYSGEAARNFGSGSQNYDSDSSVGVNPFTDANGVLTITATKSPTTLPYNLVYTSGVITSRYLASQQYGYFEAGINVPTPTGLWPSFYLLPDNNTYGGELDVAEILTKNTEQVYNVTHSVSSTGASVANLNLTTVGDLSAGFHTVGADWEPGKITYYVDGVVTAVQTVPLDLNTPMYMVLTMAVGGSFPGYPSSSFTSAGYQIDYVRSYATANTVQVSGSGTIAASALAGTVTTSSGASFAGVTVSLVNAIHQVIATSVTDSNGYFIFTNLAAGSYQVLYGATGNNVPVTGSQANSVTGLSAVTTLADGATVTLAPEVLAPSTLSAVTGTVLFGAVGGTTAAQSSVTVTLENASGTTLATTTTDSTGKFLFTNLAAGSYQVVYTPLIYDVLQASGPGGSTGTTAVFTTTAGQTTTLAPETLNPEPGLISGTIVYSGSHSEGWVGTGESGVTVSVITLTGTVIGTTVTASDGSYYISGVNAGYYYVQVTPPSGQVVAGGFGADPVTGRTARVTAVSGRATQAPTVTLINSGAPGITGTVLFSATGVTPAGNSNVVVTLLDRTDTNILATTTTDVNGAYSFINMEPGAYYLSFAAPSGETFQTGGPVNTKGVAAVTIPFGGPTVTVAAVTLLGTTGSVSGQVLYAPSGTVGSVDPGITVELLNASSTIVQTVQTDGNGNYGFTQVIPGNYSIQFVLPTNQKVLTGGPAFNGGKTSAFSIASGQNLVEPVQTLIPIPGNVSGNVLYAGSGQAGVTVSLIGSGGSVVATTTSSSTGAYLFKSVPPGSYQVLYTTPTGEALVSGGPANVGTGLTAPFAVSANQTTYLSTENLALAGGVAGSVLQANGVGAAGVTISVLTTSGATVMATSTGTDGSFLLSGLAAGNYQLLYGLPAGEMLQAGPANPNTGLTAVLTVTGGQTLSLANEIVGTGALVLATITGSTLFAGAGQAGTTVTLLNAAGTATVATTTTDATGTFSFTGLAAGTYLAQYTAPSGEVLQSGPANTSTGLTSALTVAAGQTLTLAAETLAVAPSTITGTAVLGNTSQAGITVALLNAAGTATLATTTTDATGTFSFTGLAAGTYLVQYTAPSGELLQSGPGSTSTGLTSALTVAAGQTLTLAAEILAVAPSTITGTAVFAGAPQAGIAVTLLNAAGTATLATATTDATGTFSFTGLAAGTYLVQYTAPSGELLQSGPASTSTGLTSALTVAAGQTLTLAAETLAVAPSTITGNVLFSGSGQAGVTVALLNAAGTTTLATTTTSSTGSFSFTGLIAGTYLVKYTAPSGEALQSGPGNTSTGLTSGLTVAAGQTLTLGNEVLSPPLGAITGSVKFGSAGQAGVTILLQNNTGTVTLATTTTNSLGIYGFNGLTPGYYRVQYIAPTGEIIQSGGPVNTTTGATIAFGVTSGVTRTIGPVTMLVGYATLSGSVLFAGAGQSGVAVALLNSTGQSVATTTSDNNGAFSFANITPGSYSLAYTAPTGDSFQAGDPADTTTGVTAAITLAAGQSYTAAPEHLVLTPVSLTMSGSRVTLTEGNGVFIVTGSPSNSSLTLGNGNQTVTLGGYSDVVTLGNGNDTVTLGGQTQTLHVGNGSQSLTLNGNFDTVTLGDTPSGATSTVTFTGTGESLTGGNGNVTVSGPAGSSTVTLGNGNDTVTLTGAHNTVTVGTGANVINAGTNSAIVHAAGGGNVSVTVAGQSNLVDIGPGGGVINAGTSRLDTFMLNGINQGLTIINGFSAIAGNVLDLTRTLAGTGAASDLSNLGNYVTATTSGGNTTLLVDPTGGSGTPYAFATLQNVTTSVSTLVAQHDFRV